MERSKQEHKAAQAHGFVFPPDGKQPTNLFLEMGVNQKVRSSQRNLLPVPTISVDELIEGSYKLYMEAREVEEKREKMMQGKSKYSLEISEYEVRK